MVYYLNRHKQNTHVFTLAYCFHTHKLNDTKVNKPMFASLVSYCVILIHPKDKIITIMSTLVDFSLCCSGCVGVAAFSSYDFSFSRKKKEINNITHMTNFIIFFFNFLKWHVVIKVKCYFHLRSSQILILLYTDYN